MEHQKRVLLLLSHRSYRAGAFLDAAHSAGLAVTTALDHGDLLAGEGEGAFLGVDLRDTEATIDRIVQFHQQFPLCAVVATEDEGQEAAALAAGALGLPHNEVSAVRAARHKDVMRQEFRRAGLRSPAFWVFDLQDHPRRAAEQVNFPVVLKPTFLAGSRGVIRANDSDEFALAWKEIGTLLAAPAIRQEGGAAAGRVLVEEYIEGKEFALEGIFSKGKLHLLALFDKPDPLVGPVFEETIYVTPSRENDAVQQAIRAEALLAAQAVGLVEGPVHIECRVNRDGVFVIDMAPRSIGGYCARALRFTDGMSLEEVILRAMSGDDVVGFIRESAASGVMMIPIPRGGVLHGIRGLDEARRVSHITEVIIAIRPGQPVVPLPLGGQYLGFIFARAEGPEQVEESLRDAHARLSFDIR